MDNSGFFYTASTVGASSEYEAETLLPTPLDLTGGGYEIGLIYSSVVTSWENTDDLWMMYNNTVTEDSEMIKFEKIPYTREHESLFLMSESLKERYGVNMETAPVKIYKNKDGQWKLRLPAMSMITLSDGLKFILGLSTPILDNDRPKVHDWPIEFQVYAPMEDRLFFISCNQAIENFTNSFGSNNKILDFIHAPESEPYVVKNYTNSRMGYVRLAGNLLSRLTFSLFNAIGEPVKLKDFNFLLFYHIRRIC